ncbi:hypothetical protein Cgig2_006635 [Carnegiea gigantea]|uniref:Trafficking protein particle complex subunit 11 domain-containing protein n=1 Tax=Carnegiea gigantea TaxID=171969 RepID=A0A9Q1JL51_9CARY|nr:hypothetical protein Cgig2_006635 [Carnegiea gigantea]
MEGYPEELRSPPVPLVSLVGCPELHPTISAHLDSEQPPINTLALPEFSMIAIIAKYPKAGKAAGDPGGLPPAGIIKKDWLLKHRTKVPAVVAALFAADHVCGDPAQWLQLCAHLDHVKYISPIFLCIVHMDRAVLRTRNAKFMVVVVQSSPEDDTNEERMMALRKRAEVDSKYFITFSVKDSSELVSVYYREEGTRFKTRVEKKNFTYAELGVRYCFKVAVHAEFRRDWVEALKFYEEAYHSLREMVGTTTRLPAIQRLIEIKSVAEQLHFKISTLLLHGGKIAEAVLWFRQHCASYRKLVGAAEVTFLHWEWVSRQFLVFAELLETSSKSIPGFPSLGLGVVDASLTERELQPAYYYQLASQYLKEKRSCLEQTLSMWEVLNERDGASDSVNPSGYVGQFALLLEESQDQVTMQHLTDAQFIQYAIAEAKRFRHSFEIIALLKKSFEIYTGLNDLRMASYCGSQMAKEYLSLGELKNAKQYFDYAVSLYRHEGWPTLVWEILGYLRECSRRDGSLKGFIEYSLEMAALPVSPGDSFGCKECGPAGLPSLQQRERIHEEVVGLVTGKLDFVSSDTDKKLMVTGDSPVHLEIDLVSPLRVVLLASVAFHEQLVKPGMPTRVTLSVLSQLPLPLEINALYVQFNRSDCNFAVQNAQKTPSDENYVSEPGYRVETAPALVLFTNKWLRLTYDVKSDRSGKLECVSVLAWIGSHFSLCCKAESAASLDDLSLWKFEERVESLPTKDPALAFSGQRAIQVEEPDPQADLRVDAMGPALVGERFVVPVAIASKGHSVHSGELKINLVDTRGGGLVSPREVDSHTLRSHHVELLGICGPDEEKPVLSPDNIRKIQHSFGLISVPFLKDGKSWSCKLEITWHRPKPVMLFVSLSYSPQSDDVDAQKVHIHRSLQIEGEIPVLISHQIMLPFRCEPLLLSKVKRPAEADMPLSLPLNETSLLIVSAKNCTEVPLRILSITVERDDNAGNSCIVCSAGNHVNTEGPDLLVPDEEYKKVFSFIPETNTSKVRMGTVFLKWMRDSGPLEQGGSDAFGVLTKHKLPDAAVEVSPLVVSMDCPPHAVLGHPFTYFIEIQNQTKVLQEIKFSLQDSHSFVTSGSHDDTVFVLPKSRHVLSYKLVPLASGSQELPRFTLISMRYSSVFQPSVIASAIFVFPAKPQFEMKRVGNSPEPKLLAAE